MGNKNNKNAVKAELSEEEIDFLVSNTNYDRAKVLEWFSGFMNDCPDGKLDKKEFEKVYTELYQNGNPAKFSNLVFEVFDSDDSKYINFSEFLLALATLQSGDLNKRLNLAFKIYDVNSNGHVDLKEMTKVIEAVYDLKGVPKTERTGELSAASRAKAIFNKLDADESKGLNVDEFVNGIAGDSNLAILLLPN